MICYNVPCWSSWLSNNLSLAVLNLYVALMPPIKFLKSSIRLRTQEMILVHSAMCRVLCTASYQVSTQPDSRFVRRCGLKNFKMVAIVAIFDIKTK